MTGPAALELPDGRQVALDGDGHLRHPEDWNEDVARALATREGLELTPEHWELVWLLRDYHQRFEQLPAMRALVKFAALELGADKGRSLHLLRLFPGSPPRRIARIAGLPRPEHCL